MLALMDLARHAYAALIAAGAGSTGVSVTLRKTEEVVPMRSATVVKHGWKSLIVFSTCSRILSNSFAAGRVASGSWGVIPGRSAGRACNRWVSAKRTICNTKRILCVFLSGSVRAGVSLCMGMFPKLERCANPRALCSAESWAD